MSERKGAEIIEAEGAQKIIAADYHLSTPAVVTDAITVYRANNDWLNIFLEECCDLGDNRSQKSGRLYEKYREYCQQTGEYARSTTDFYAALEAAGYSRKVTSTGKIILGLSLKDNLFS